MTMLALAEASEIVTIRHSHMCTPDLIVIQTIRDVSFGLNVFIELVPIDEHRVIVQSDFTRYSASVSVSVTQHTVLTNCMI